MVLEEQGLLQQFHLSQTALVRVRLARYSIKAGICLARKAVASPLKRRLSVLEKKEATCTDGGLF